MTDRKKYMRGYMKLWNRALSILKERHFAEFMKILKELKGGKK